MTREQWLEERKKGIGASDAACILGMSPYKTNLQLWEEKTGKKQAEDISNKSYVKYGIDAEQPLRELFKLDYPQYILEHNEFKMHKNQQHPFIFATLDGEILDQDTRERGILEIKTADVMSGMQMDNWKDRIPQGYYLQILHQLLATGWDFAILKAQLKTEWSGELRIQTKHYTIRREEVLDDIEYLKQKEVKFWTQHVMKDKQPPLKLPSI